MTKHAELLEQIAELKIQAEKARKKEIEAAVSQINALVIQYSLTPKDLTFNTSAKKQISRSNVSIRYRDSAGNTWIGRGRTPRWLATAEDAGKKRESFLVD